MSRPRTGSQRPPPRRRPAARPPHPRQPIFVSRRLATAAGVAALLLLVLVLALVPAVLTIALGGLALALALWFPVRWLMHVLPDRLAIPATLTLLLLALVVALLLVVPPLLRQLSALVDNLPEISTRVDGEMHDAIAALERRGFLPTDADQVVGNMRRGLFQRATGAGEGLLLGALGTVSGAFAVIVQTFGIMFVAVYLLSDATRLRDASIQRTPLRYRADVTELWETIEDTLARYMAGILLVSVLQGVLVGLWLWVFDVPYALLLGAWVAATAVVPYLGSWFGAIPLLILAFLVSPLTGALTWLWFFVVQTVVGNFVTPRVQGDALRVHPVIVLLAVVAAGSLFGLLGVLFAAPALGIGRVLYDFTAARVRLAPPVR